MIIKKKQDKDHINTKIMLKITDMLDCLLEFSDTDVYPDQEDIDWQSELQDLRSEIVYFLDLEYNQYEKLEHIYGDTVKDL